MIQFMSYCQKRSQPDESGRAVPVAAVALPSRLHPSLHPPDHSNGQAARLRLIWLVERPTPNGAVWQRVDPARLGGLRFSATTGGALIAVLTGTLVR